MGEMKTPGSIGFQPVAVGILADRALVKIARLEASLHTLEAYAPLLNFAREAPFENRYHR